MKKMFFVSLVLSSSLTFAAKELPASVYAAHEAYLKCDAQEIFENVRNALKESNNHPLILDNTMNLMKAAKKNGCLNYVEADFTLPAEISYLELEIQRKLKSESGKVTYVFNAAVGVNKGHELESFQVIRYPDQVLVDKEAGIGEMEATVSDTENELWISGVQSIKPIQEGLYLVNVKLKNRPLVKAYAIINDMNSSASPVVLAPDVAQTLTGPQPMFSFKHFVSPEKKDFEKSRVNLSVRDESNSSDLIWVRLKDDKATSFKVGDMDATREYQGQSDLSPGNYLFQLSIREIEYFGGIGIRRASTTRVPFIVK